MKQGDLVSLVSKDNLYHRSRATRHGTLYVVHRVGPMGLIEAKSLSTGAIITVDKQFLTGSDDNEQ